MDHFVPVPDDVEDQRYAKEVLYAHVTARSIQVCAGLATVGTLASAPFVKSKTVSLTTRVLTNNSRAVLLGLVAGPVMTFGRMQGQAAIDWQDRTWRLLQNPGQNNADIGFVVGSVVGGLGAAAASSVPGVAAFVPKGTE
ncbi:hypothetical protein H310_06180 [Aphanomyces invadans]|uniref:Uncharacterized protein n=1 Tax=Aphanomyces invadans TaxID=157072 RepID=A0A024U539_9STRA|nr:hypothetical protein H310_06180 [Aphanomyces invadans]ETW01516.1 hypothetical protein H310_06180 [Aphanomyces invadans]|eukprot:XP_008869364.1 hypothetical protein H310_06180 [Aphanomyces invadans]